MELDPQEKSHVWWKGTWKGALKGLLIGALVGAATALALGGLCAIPVLHTALAPVFGGFFTMSGGFSVIPLAIFSGISGMVGNMLASGASEVNAYREQKHHQMYETQIAELEGREQMLEHQLVSSRTVQTIINRGPRNQGSFTETEAARTNAPTTPTIH